MGSGKWVVWIAGTAVAFGEQAAAPGEDVKTQLWDSRPASMGSHPICQSQCGEASPCHPWKLSIVWTVFWIGETGSGPSNARSAWDSNWVAAYGGVDDPLRRKGFEPVAFRPRENPFLSALPYCDIQARPELKAEAARVVPWYIARLFHGPSHSVCKGR